METCEGPQKDPRQNPLLCPTHQEDGETINQLVIGSQDLHGSQKVEGSSHPQVQVALGRTGRGGHAETRGLQRVGRDTSGPHLQPSSPDQFARI